MSRSGKSTLSWIIVGAVFVIGGYVVWRDPEGVFNRLRDVWEAVVALFPRTG